MRGCSLEEPPPDAGPSRGDVLRPYTQAEPISLTISWQVLTLVMAFTASLTFTNWSSMLPSSMSCHAARCHERNADERFALVQHRGEGDLVHRVATALAPAGCDDDVSAGVLGLEQLSGGSVERAVDDLEPGVFVALDEFDLGVAALIASLPAGAHDTRRDGALDEVSSVHDVAMHVESPLVVGFGGTRRFCFAAPLETILDDCQ